MNKYYFRPNLGYMTFKDVIFGIGDLIESSFVLMELGGNNVNVLFILVGSVLMAWWIAQMIKFNKDAKENGTLE